MRQGEAHVMVNAVIEKKSGTAVASEGCLSLPGISAEIVRAILLLAHNLKMDVVAEGVETVEQLAQLRALDCEYAQGYLFAPPLDAEAAETLLSENRKW